VYEADWPTACVVVVEPRRDQEPTVLTEDWRTTPPVGSAHYHDVYGNLCRRLTIPAGRSLLRYDARVHVSAIPDEVGLDAAELAPADLPADTLLYTLPSRYCLSDRLNDTAWSLFGSVTPGWSRVQAVCDWVHNEVTFGYGSSSPDKTAADTLESRTGVCRDFAHLAITFCRALNIPSRYVFGYLPDIDVEPPPDPMDFCAWMQVYLGDRWWTFDPRNNRARIGRVVIGWGRDAADVAMVTSYGAPKLVGMEVWADELDDKASR
jgi:transglutaminase-like putative cysteine protease